MTRACVGLGVRERLGDERGEVRELAFGSDREWDATESGRDECAPDLPAELDGGGHSRPVAKAREPLDHRPG